MILLDICILPTVNSFKTSTKPLLIFLFLSFATWPLSGPLVKYVCVSKCFKLLCIMLVADQTYSVFCISFLRILYWQLLLHKFALIILQCDHSIVKQVYPELALKKFMPGLCRTVIDRTSSMTALFHHLSTYIILLSRVM